MQEIVIIKPVIRNFQTHRNDKQKFGLQKKNLVIHIVQ